MCQLKSAWPRQRDAENRTALHYAVAYKHKDIFDELLASGADLSAQVGIRRTLKLCLKLRQLAQTDKAERKPACTGQPRQQPSPLCGRLWAE